MSRQLVKRALRQRSRETVRALALLVGFLAGCGSDEASDTPAKASVPPEAVAANDPKPAPAADGCDGIDLAAPAAGAGIQLSIDMPLQPGEERQVCKLVMVESAVNLNFSQGLYTKGAHHGITARTSYHGVLPAQNISGEDVDDPTATATCESIGSDWDFQGVLASGDAIGAHPQSLTNKGVLPDDVALKIASGDVLELNFHMINTSDHPVHACYKQNLNGIPDEQVKQEAGTMFWYDSFITVPANTRAKTTIACPITQDVTLANQVSHMHRRGVGYSAQLLDGDPLTGGQEIQSLYDGTTWDEPSVRVDSPGLALSTGQWIKWSCDYQNSEARDIAQGQQTTDEMCMFIGTYWPRSSAMDGCSVQTDQGELPSSRLLADGTKTAPEALDCWAHSAQATDGGGPESSADRFASQSCFTEACANVSGHLIELLTGAMDPAAVSCD